MGDKAEHITTVRVLAADLLHTVSFNSIHCAVHKWYKGRKSVIHGALREKFRVRSYSARSTPVAREILTFLEGRPFCCPAWFRFRSPAPVLIVRGGASCVWDPVSRVSFVPRGVLSLALAEARPSCT